MLAFCGLVCDNCPIHLATLEENLDAKSILRKSVADLCKDQYGMSITPEEINDCDGCRAGTGRLFSGCWECQIRACAMDKQIDSCAFCEHYPCETLDSIFNSDPEAKYRLDSIHREPN